MTTTMFAPISLHAPSHGTTINVSQAPHSQAPRSQAPHSQTLRRGLPLGVIPRQHGRGDTPKLAGFTFIEILVVIIILALIAGVVGISLKDEPDKARIGTTRIQISQLRTALDLYRFGNSRYPATKQGLKALLSQPEVGVVPKNWQGPYLNTKVLPKDGWSNPFIYTSSGGDYVIISYGADGVEGGTEFAADISSNDF